MNRKALFLMVMITAMLVVVVPFDTARAASSIASANNQSWSVGQVAAPMQAITWTEDGVTPVVTAGNDLRVMIPSIFSCTWDTTITTMTFTGTASGKVSTTVTYQDGGKTMLIWVNSSFAASETLIISGGKFTNFTAISASDNLEVDIDNDGTGDYTDSATIEITAGVYTNTPTTVPTATPTATPVPTATDTPVPATSTPTPVPATATPTPSPVYSSIPEQCVGGRKSSYHFDLGCDDNVDRPRMLRLPNWAHGYGSYADSGVLAYNTTTGLPIMAKEHVGWVSFAYLTPTPTPYPTVVPGSPTWTPVPTATAVPTATFTPVAFTTTVDIDAAVDIDFDASTEKLEVDDTTDIDGGAVTKDTVAINRAFTDSTAHNLSGSALHISDGSVLDAGGTDSSNILLLDTDSGEVLSVDLNGKLSVTNNDATSEVTQFNATTSQTARVSYWSLGAWLGTADQGALEVSTTAAATVPAGQLMRLNQAGTGQHASAIDGSVIYVYDGAAAPGAGTSYAMSINAANIEALHVDAGKVQFDETLDVTGAITGGTLTDGTVSFTAGAVTGMTGVTGSMMSNDTVTADQLSDTLTLDADLSIVAPAYAIKGYSEPVNGSEVPDFYGHFATYLAPLGTMANGTTNTQVNVDDSPDGEWAQVDADTTITADATYYKAGSTSLKVAFADTAAAGDGATNPLTAGDQDWSDDENVTFWVYSNAALSAGDISLMITDNASDEEITFPEVLADTWTIVTLDVSGVANADKDAITDISVELTAAGAASLGAFNLYLDLGATWDTADQTSLGKRAYHGGVQAVAFPTAAGVTASLTEWTDYFIVYDNPSVLVPITDQSANTGFALVSYR